jgi:Spy/CpxP family protein refolding chaperone
MAAELGLTDVQQADMRKVMEGARRDRLRKSTDLKIARMDLQSLLREEKVDEKAVSSKLAEAQAAQGALLKLRVDSALQLKRILTPEQQKRMNEMRDRRRMNWMDGGSRMRRSQPGRPGTRPRMGAGPGEGDFDLDLDDLDSDDEGEPGLTREEIGLN